MFVVIIVTVAIGKYNAFLCLSLSLSLCILLFLIRRFFFITDDVCTSALTTSSPTLYSAFGLDSATVDYFLLLQNIAPLMREKTKLDVDRLLAL